MVRELGRPDLALAFAEHGRRDAGPTTLGGAHGRRPGSRRGRTRRDLESARDAGLLDPARPASRTCCAGGVLGPPSGGPRRATCESLRRLVGHAVALDGLESRAPPGCRVVTWPHRSPERSDETGLVGDGQPQPRPAVVGRPGRGRAAVRRRGAGGRPVGGCAALADELLDALLARRIPRLTIDWHLGAARFRAGGADRLARVASLALGGRAGRLRVRPAAPAAGAGAGAGPPPPGRAARSRAEPAGAGPPGGAARGRRALPPAPGDAGPAGAERGDPEARPRPRGPNAARRGKVLTSGFLLDRARFVVVPVGLDEVVTQFTGWGMSSGGESLDLGALARPPAARGARPRRPARADGLLPRRAGRHSPLRVTSVTRDGGRRPDALGRRREPAQPGPRRHRAARGQRGGTLALFVPPETTSADLAAVLQELWRQTAVVRAAHSAR